MIGYTYPGCGVKLPYAELRVPPERTLHEWADRHGLTIVRLVSDLPAVAA